LAYSVRTLRFGRFKGFKSIPEPDGIELIDGKYPDAALRATGMTDQPLPTSTRGIRQRRVHYLN
jgi:hypothetical protein